MRLSRGYGAAVVRLRWLIVVGWLAFAAVLSMFLPTLEESGGTGGFEGFADADNPAIQAEIRSFEKFGFPVLTRTAVVQRDPEGLTTGTQLRAFVDAIDFNLNRPAELRRIEFALPVTNSIGLIPGQERDTTAITYLFFRPDVSFRAQTALAHEYAERYAGDPRDDLVGVSGVIPGRTAQLKILGQDLHRVELLTIGLIFLIVALNYRSLVAPIVTMATAGLSLSIIVRIAGWAGGEFGFDVPSEIEPVIVALLLGIVTDYSIFFLSGMRERLAAGDGRLEAARHSTAEFAPIVLVAGLTVAAGSLAVLVARVGPFRTFGPGMALTILIGLVVAVTFVPACLAIFGSAVFWPHKPRRPGRVVHRQPRRGVLIRAIARRGGAFVAVVVAGGALVAAAAPLPRMNLGFGVTSSLPPAHEATRAAGAAGEGFFTGILSPAVLLLEGSGVTERRPQLARLERLLHERSGVATVGGPADQLSPVDLGIVLSTSGDAARYVIVLADDPLGADAIDQLHELRADMPNLLAEAGLSGVSAEFAGDTALAETTVTQTEEDLGRIVLVATGLGFILLVLFLRALVAPIFLMAANLLAVGASLGLTTLVFQTIGGQAGITFFVPFAAAVLLIALGADYSIFGVGYIWAEARRNPLAEAIMIAVPRSTRAINAAGLALALSFASLAVVPLAPFREFAFAMGVGILIDVFVVRSILVPSIITVIGTASGWPGRGLRGAVEAKPEPVAAGRPGAVTAAAVHGGGRLQG
ncbi:MAG: MMPL family transporter, partial [Actinomycetota bacterium]|nr:MMPL family transporter [Actinomycetota bacterium]